MSRKPRRLARLAVAAGILVAFGLAGLYWAVRHEPAFYRRAKEIKPDVLDKASDRMLQHIAEMQSAATRQGPWKFTITAEEINGWLTVDLKKNHANTLPPSVHDPRVSIDPDRLTVGCRYEGIVTSVLSLTVQPYVPERNVVALRVIRGRAGALPLPLKRVLDGLSQAAADLHLQLRWVQADSDPVAMLSLPEDEDADRVVRIDTLELGDGKITLSGVTERRKR
jgi:hypothetical protein